MSRYNLRFRNKRIALSFNPRKGKCSFCNSIRQTQMHHYADYYIIFPWFATEELCLSCHKRKAWEKGEHNKQRKREEFPIYPNLL